MKTWITSILILHAGWLFSQSSLPETVQSEFRFRYPHAKDVEWKSNHKGFEVSFKLCNTPMQADYDKSGTWQSTVKSTEFSKLPAVVQSEFNHTKYHSWSISEVEELQKFGQPVQFRISVIKFGLEKKNLLFKVNEGLVKEN